MQDDLRNVPPPRVWGAEEYNRSGLRLWAHKKRLRIEARLSALGAALNPFRWLRGAMDNIGEPGRSLIRGAFWLTAYIWGFAYVAGKWIEVDGIAHWWEPTIVITGVLFGAASTCFVVFGWLKR